MSDVITTNHKEDLVEADMNELKKLQQRLNHESIRYQFRTKLVGGLNEEDVTKYIVDLEDKLKKIEQENKKSSDEIYSLKNKLNIELELKDNLQTGLDEAKQNLITAIVEFKQKQMDYKSLNEKNNSENLQLKCEIQQMTEEQKKLETLITETNHEKELLKLWAAKVEDENQILKIKISELSEEQIKYNHIKNENILLNEKISELENSIYAKNYKFNEISGVCEELKQQLQIEKSNNAKLNMDSVILKQKINSLQQTINEKLKELEEQKKINDDTLLELDMEKAEVLNYKINGFKQEFGSIIEKIESLEREAKQSSKLSSILKQQLVIQQNRAEKAENDLAKIIELLSHVEDKFHNKRDILGDEFIQLIEKQITKRYQINDKIINL